MAGFFDLDGPLVPDERDTWAYMILALSVLFLILSFVGIFISGRLCCFGTVNFLPILGYAVNMFFMTTACLGIFAEMYNWIDGLFSCSIMCILSGVYGIITILFGISFIKNDQDSDEIKPQRKKTACILEIIYLTDILLCMVLAISCEMRRSSLETNNPPYIFGTESNNPNLN